MKEGKSPQKPLMFYYLIVMFQLTLLGPAFKWVAEHIPVKVSLPIALVISWGSELYLSKLIGLLVPGYAYQWSDRTVTTYLVYYLAGCYIGMHYDAFTEKLKKAWLPVSAELSVRAEVLAEGGPGVWVEEGRCPAGAPLESWTGRQSP